MIHDNGLVLPLQISSITPYTWQCIGLVLKLKFPPSKPRQESNICIHAIPLSLEQETRMSKLRPTCSQQLGRADPEKSQSQRAVYDSTFTMRPYPHMQISHHATSKPKVMRAVGYETALITTTNLLACTPQQGTNRCWMRNSGPGHDVGRCE